MYHEDIGKTTLEIWSEEQEVKRLHNEKLTEKFTEVATVLRALENDRIEQGENDE